jgi:LuxR family maltose regulon positive regulatory protein
MESLLRIHRSQGAHSEHISKLLAAFPLSKESSEPGRTGSKDSCSQGFRLIEPLSERELEVLRYLNCPQEIPEIAREIRIAPSTLRSHVRSIYLKLDVHGRLEALQKARELGLF